MSVSFSKAAIIFEDAYVTSPGVTVQKRSSTAALRVSAFGGAHGGTVSFTAANLDKVSPLGCGPLTLPSSLELGPFETYSDEFSCEGASASGSAGDVVVTGSFTENETGATYSANDSLTVFSVEIKAVVWPSGNECTHRHKYGVREVVNIIQCPATPALQWSRMGGGRKTNNGKYQCPLFRTENPIALSFGDAEYKPFLNVIEPSWITVNAVVDHRYGVHIGEAGGIGMDIMFAIGPFDVCFDGIAVEEVPCASGERTGYFSHPAFASLQSHTTENGAGRWLGVQENNDVDAIDQACIESSMPRMTPGGVLTNDVQFGWIYGDVTWEIPFGWGETDSGEFDPPAGLFATDETSMAVIFVDGKCGVRKFLHQVTRTTNDVVVLDGVVK